MTATFPTLAGLQFPVGRSPIWSTERQRSVSGKGTAQQRYTYPLYRFELSFEFLRSDDENREWQTLAAFYNLVMAGSAGLFQFNDPDDGATANQGFGVGNGIATTFQLVRAQGDNVSVNFVEPVFAPTGAPTIMVGGIALATPGDYTIGPTGLVTFAAPPANGADLTWTGTFNWWCRFDDDSADFQKFMNRFWSLGKVGFTTEKI